MRSNATHVCRQCTRLLRKDVVTRTSFILSNQRLFSQSSTRYKSSSKKQQSPQFWPNDVTVSSADHASLVTKAQSIGNGILNSQTIPSEDEVQKALELLKYASLQLNNSLSQRSSSRVDQLLGFVSTDPASRNQKQKETAKVSSAINVLSSLAYKIVKHPPVFINENILKSYIEVQLALNRPASLPEIFDLYAHKPVPIPDSSPIRYKQPSASAASQAVPKPLADQVLDYAIKEKQLTLALDVITSTYAAPAFERNKFVRKALPTLFGIGMTPVAAIPLAQAWASMSNVADPAQLTMFAWIGMLTYVTSVSSLGFVAITTYNDQMERVTWTPGMPLRLRWLKEDERAALDKVALAWGFKEVDRRGEEEGPEWDLLREWCGRRGMLLDATNLMEGME
jgi:hypothetical protein